MVKKVIIYSTEFCPFCKLTKEFFKEHGIKYKDIDVGKDAKKAEEMIRKSGQQGVPVVEIGGEIVVGFNESKLRELLKIRNN